MNQPLNIKIDKYDIGKDYDRNGQKCLFDPVRKMLVPKTAKEIVRQKFIRYLKDDRNIPEDNIVADRPMSFYQYRAKGKADIIVLFNQNHNDPMLLVECVGSDSPVTDSDWNRLCAKGEKISANYIILTSGTKTYAAVTAICTDTSELSYVDIDTDELPDSSTLWTDDKDDESSKCDKNWVRPVLSKLYSSENINEFYDKGWIGIDTDAVYYPLVINLAAFLHDTSIKMSPAILETFKIFDDGFRYTVSGNASGGIWDGNYRSFLIEDKNKNHQVVSINLFGTASCKNDPVYGNRKGNTALVVAVDNFDTTHNSLQLDIDKYTKNCGNKFTIWHDGTITVGRSGAAKRSDLIDFISENDPGLLDSNGKVLLGTLDCSKLLSWNQPETRQFFEKLIRYALVRDEFRENVKWAKAIEEFTVPDPIE